MLMILASMGCRLDPIDAPDMGSWLDANDGQQQSGGPDSIEGQVVADLPVAGKIVIVTSPGDHDEVFRVARAFASSYSEEQVVHMTWPHDGSGRLITDLLRDVSEDPEVGALIVTNLPGGQRFISQALSDIRDEIFVVYTAPISFATPNDVAADIRADLIIGTDMRSFGENYVIQAKSMGADTIVHYSFPRHQAVPAFANRRDAMKATAERVGVDFIELEMLDPWNDLFFNLVPTYLVQDLPRQVRDFGANTAFFATDCIMQRPVISQVIATGAIFVSPCCPSPYHGYLESIGIEYEIPTRPTSDADDFGMPIAVLRPLPELLREIDEAADAAGVTGRISSWAVSDSMMWTTIGFMYAAEWLSGNVTQERGVIDIEALRGLAAGYMAQLGIAAGVTFEPLTRDGEIIGNYIQGVVDYYVFG
jgi:hypothetical protein